MDAATALSPVLTRLIGGPPSGLFRFWDGSALGPSGAHAAIHVRSPQALRRLATAPGELGLARAYVAGDVDLEGDLEAVLALDDLRPDLRLGPAGWLAVVRAAAATGALRVGRVPRPPEEARLRGRRHSRARDAAAIAHHYDLSNDFYRLVLGPSLTYSCAYFASPQAFLEDAQADKHELICRKLRLAPGERLLDVGCGWGSLALHAAKHHQVEVVGVTLSRPQAELGAKHVVEAGVADRVTIRARTSGTSTTAPTTRSPASGCSSTSGRSGSPGTSRTCTRSCAPRAGC